MTNWWWLSFGCPDTGKFKGLVIVDAQDFFFAHMAVNLLGCNPGGEIVGYDITSIIDEIKTEDRYRLLNEEEAKMYGTKLIRESENEPD